MMITHPDNKDWVQGPFDSRFLGRTLVCVEDLNSALYGLGSTYTLSVLEGDIVKTPHPLKRWDSWRLDCGWFMFIEDQPFTEDEIQEMIG